MRLDIYLYQFGYLKSRQKAKSLIESKNVIIDGVVITKPSFDIDENTNYKIEITGDCPYVSRGGLKLESMLNYASVSVNDKICIDIGASSGGFTDCLLKCGAQKVYAVDSGSNQLDPTLKNDSRVISIENYNARNLNVSDIGQLVDLITIDVSFISQTLIMPNAISLLKDDGLYISLIKPQFEAGRSYIGKGGIVKDKNARFLSVMRVIECANALSFKCNYLIESPITGGDGNIEYLAIFSKNDNEIDINSIKKLIHKWWGKYEI